MSFSTLLLTFLQILIVTLLVVWWLRWTQRGVEWVTIFLFGAVGLSYLSSFLFRMPPYQVSCDGLCPGWLGFPILTHRVETGGIIFFDPVSFVRNVFFYYAVSLAFGGLIAWLGRRFRWSARSWKKRFLFIILVIVLPLATLPLWISPPQPHPSGPEQRLVINAARDWRWQLGLSGFMERRFALEDVRLTPDHEYQRVCFRIYTWFYLPYGHGYVDMEPEGVRAVAGDETPLSESCWTQP